MKNFSKRDARLVAALLLVGVGQWFVAASNVHAAIVSWAIDSLQSSVTLAFPNQGAIVGGIPVTVHVANQSGIGSTWNDGNTSPLAGTVLTDFQPTTIQFLPGGSNLSALTSGSYRPAPGSFSGGNYTTTLPALADFGGKLEEVTGPFDLMYFALDAITYDIASAPLPYASPTVFNATGVGFGMSSGTVLADGVSNPFGSISDTNLPLTPTGGFAGFSIGSISLGVMTLNFSVPVSINFGNGIVLSGGSFGGDGESSPLDGPLSVEGEMLVQMVAYQVPEPPTRWLAVLGGFAVAALAAGRRRRRRA